MASSLIESLRDIGYTLEAAIADIIDNSITAKANLVKIYFDIFNNNPILAIIDNGLGMNYEEMIMAMRIGSKNPLETRDCSDLGRFGLGLKTASFSQCRKLTIVSSRNNQRIGMCWDLDFVASTNDWTIKILDEKTISNLYKINDLGTNGTYALWENIDRIVDNTVKVKFEEEIYSKIDIVKKHLELVFHRYLDGEFGKSDISINDDLINGFDPFNKKNNATRLLAEDSIDIDGHTITIQPFILPHHSKVSKKEYELYEGLGGYLKNQGFYVYRNGRLLIHGTWFRLSPQKELYKLARVQIDLPNALDDLWKIDVKKSNASPPTIIRDRLKKIIDKITGNSTRIYISKGHRESSAANAFWQKETARGSIKYCINKNHPCIEEFLDDLPEYKKNDFKVLLNYIGEFFPIDLAITDYVNSPKDFEKPNIDDYQLEKLASNQYQFFKDSFSKEQFIEFLEKTEPTNKYNKNWKHYMERNL